MRRVVVTGVGLVTPLACGTEQTWSRLLAGDSGINAIETFDVSDIPCRIAGQVPRGDGSFFVLDYRQPFGTFDDFPANAAVVINPNSRMREIVVNLRSMWLHLSLQL